MAIGDFVKEEVFTCSTPLSRRPPRFLRRRAFGNISKIRCENTGNPSCDSNQRQVEETDCTDVKYWEISPDATVMSSLQDSRSCALQYQSPVQSLCRYSKMRQPLNRRSNKSRERFEILRQKYSDVTKKGNALLYRVQQQPNSSDTTQAKQGTTNCCSRHLQRDVNDNHKKVTDLSSMSPSVDDIAASLMYSTRDIVSALDHGKDTTVSHPCPREDNFNSCKLLNNNTQCIPTFATVVPSPASYRNGLRNAAIKLQSYRPVYV